jgi:hypothetical protein
VAQTIRSRKLAWAARKRLLLLFVLLLVVLPVAPVPVPAAAAAAVPPPPAGFTNGDVGFEVPMDIWGDRRIFLSIKKAFWRMFPNVQFGQ